MSGTIGALSVVRPDVTDMPEPDALASQMNHKQSRFKSSARPMLDPDKVDNTDAKRSGCFRMVGRRDSATESRVLQGRDARSI